jgi:hypothetical protein
MTPIELLVFLLMQFGLAYIVGHSEISLPVRYMLSPPVAETENVTPLPRRGWSVGRWLVRLVECPACFGFWAGGIAALSFGLSAGTRTGRADVFLFWGCAVAGSNFLLARLSRLI